MSRLAVYTGCADVIDADGSGHFDAISHAELMRRMARWIGDRHVLALTGQRLVAPVGKDGGRGRQETQTLGSGNGTMS